MVREDKNMCRHDLYRDNVWFQVSECMPGILVALAVLLLILIERIG